MFCPQTVQVANNLNRVGGDEPPDTLIQSWGGGVAKRGWKKGELLLLSSRPPRLAAKLKTTVSRRMDARDIFTVLCYHANACRKIRHMLLVFIQPARASLARWSPLLVHGLDTSWSRMLQP